MGGGALRKWLAKMGDDASSIYQDLSGAATGGMPGPGGNRILFTPEQRKKMATDALATSAPYLGAGAGVAGAGLAGYDLMQDDEDSELKQLLALLEGK